MMGAVVPVAPLFASANRRERFADTAAFGADAIIVDPDPAILSGTGVAGAMVDRRVVKWARRLLGLDAS